MQVVTLTTKLYFPRRSVKPMILLGECIFLCVGCLIYSYSMSHAQNCALNRFKSGFFSLVFDFPIVKTLDFVREK